MTHWRDQPFPRPTHRDLVGAYRICRSVALTRPVSNVAVASSLCLGRELPQLSSKIVADHFKKPDVTTNRQTHQPAKRLRAAPAGKPVAITRVRHTSESSAVQALLPKFLTMYMIYSDLLTRLHSSENSTTHLMRILDGFSPNTIFRYLSCLIAFAGICRNLRIDLSDLDDIRLADLLMAGASEAGKFSSMTLKAIRWSWKQFTLTCFKDCFSPVVSSFCRTKFATERKESLPLPLIVLIQWERRILQSASTTAEILLLGTFLLMAFSGMRFGDIQRVMVHRLQYDGKTLRGVSWKTKTCNSGVPFGIVCHGFLSKGTHHWVHKFLLCLDSVLDGHDPNQIDFMLPSVQDEDIKTPLSAMPYSEALFYLRSFMPLPWKSQQLVYDNTTHYTIHGLKSTFLSWASQLRIDPECRRLQGHHKDPLQSTRLYSRDDIDGSIFVQEQIVTQVCTGWRPQTPLGRGGQLPLREPQVILESFKKAAVEHTWKFFQFNAPKELVIMPDQLQSSDDSSASSSSSATSDSDHPAAGSSQNSKPSRVIQQCDEMETGSYRNTVHIIMDWGDLTTPESDRKIRTACGRFFPTLQHFG